MKYLTTDLMNWYIESYNVKCPKNDGGEGDSWKVWTLHQMQ